MLLALGLIIKPPSMITDKNTKNPGSSPLLKIRQNNNNKKKNNEKKNNLELN